MDNFPDLCEEHKLQVKVDSCLICGQVAVTYDLEGNVIKTEPLDRGNGKEVGGNPVKWSNEQLLTFLCQSLGLRNKKLYSSLQADPFPFCEQCQMLLNSLAHAFSHLAELKNVLREKLEEAEQLYSKDNLYERHDPAYLKFRKDALREVKNVEVGESWSERLRKRNASQSNLRVEVNQLSCSQSQVECRQSKSSSSDSESSEAFEKGEEELEDPFNILCQSQDQISFSDSATTSDDKDNGEKSKSKVKNKGKMNRKRSKVKAARVRNQVRKVSVQKCGSGLETALAANRSRSKGGGFMEREEETGNINYTTGYGNRFKSFRTTLTFAKIAREDGTMGYQCTTCSATFPLFTSSRKQEPIFRQHYLASHSNRFKCRLCPDVEASNYGNRQDLFQHLEKVHGVSTTRNYHMLITNGKRERFRVQAECEICKMPMIPCGTGPSFRSTKQAYRTHLLSHMNEEEKKEALLVYGVRYKQLSTPLSTTLELSLTSSASVSQCGTCGQFITNGETGMRMHERDSHPELHDPYQLPTFICHICAHSLSSNALLDLHIRKKHPDGRLDERELHLQCKFPSCPEKMWDDEPSLKAHVEKMHGKSEQASARVLCRVCGMVSCSTWALKQHGLVHSGERAHHCTLCPKSFPLKTTLTSHLAAKHGIGAKIMECEHQGCHKIFYNRIYFRIHMRKAHGVVVKKRKAK
ncbi:unnamed protein product [Orchesella dallaii]|uniref:C2H2-type domain-containing protein n=1 Tax=Orchesella dallaii TaxID=48710 RepID=A0ABP1SA87_9HEXA